MEPNGKGAARADLRFGLLTEASPSTIQKGPEPGVVFDFTGLRQPGLCDLALILTARLQSAPDQRVWVKALPDTTWSVLQALGLDHLFHVLPGPGRVVN